MTASARPSSGTERLSRRAAGAVLAGAVQSLFIAALLHWAVPPQSVVREPKEIFLRMVPSAPPAPPMHGISAPTAPVHRPAASVSTPSPTVPSVIALPSDITRFGQSLFGCAPENYATLTPEARDHCIKPGEGLVYNRLPNLMGEQSRVKDNARWANTMAHRQTLRMLPGGMFFPLVALGAILDGSISEPHSAFRDPEQWPNERDPRQFMPRRPDEQERIYADWHRDHPEAQAPAH